MLLPDDERVFNPSRETHRILGQARSIGVDAHRPCELERVKGIKSDT